MEKFLENVATYILQKFETRLDTVTCILPSHRAGLFLKKYLGEKSGKAIWSPQVTTMHEWINSLSQGKILSNTQLLFELFDAFKIADHNQTNFSKFLQWGSILLQDIAMIDQHLVDSNLLFTDLRNIKDIENWSLGSDELTDSQIHYADFWLKIGLAYNNFNALLEKKEATYFAKNAKDLANGKIELIGTDSTLFIGFNALSPAESEIIRKYKTQNRTELIWDADVYYIENKREEAGNFIRPYWESDNSGFKFLEDRLSGSKEINIHASTSDIQEANRIGYVLNELSTEELGNTALILADENLLIPILNALPAKLAKANISMGYPLPQNSVMSIFEVALQFLRGCIDGNDKMISYTDLVFFFGNELISENKFDLDKFEQDARKANLSGISRSQVNIILKGYNWQKWNFLFDNSIHNVNEMSEKLQLLIASLMETLNKEDTLIEFEILQLIKDSINEMTVTFNDYNQKAAVNDYCKLILKKLKSEKLSFVGKPLEGLQILGMLESRALDFDHVIIAGVNEGVLPLEKNNQSFIPFDIKRRHHLPTHRENEAISAYYFYRIIQKACKVDLFYNESVDFKKNERSRFIEQLEFASQTGSIKSKLNFVISPTSMEEVNIPNVVIEKTPDLIKQIKEKLKEKISPSALKDYMECPLNFYYRHILGLSEFDAVTKDVKTAVLGSAVHDALDKLYKPFIGEQLKESDLEILRTNAKQYLEEALKKRNKFSNFKKGIDHLVFKIGEKFIADFINLDRKNIKLEKIKIEHLEKKFSQEFIVNYGEEKIPVTLLGYIDRIEKYNGNVRIIDYKTGKVDSNDLVIKSDNELEKKPKLFQLLAYCWLYAKESGNYKLTGGIYSFPRIKNGLIPIKYNGNETLGDNDFKEFENHLKIVINKILDEKIPFEHNASAKYCSFCS